MKVACVQMDVTLGDVGHNLEVVLRHLKDLHREGVELVVFPEAALTGYCVSCIEDAESIALPVESTAVQKIDALSQELDMIAVVGAAEKSSSVKNVAYLFEKGQPVRTYVKSHLPYLGLDRFVTPGRELPVFETRLGKIGILVCFDLRYPEAARTLALKGADLIALPTNWPEGAETSADFVSISRAAENGVFLLACNRVGLEEGFRFIGRSKIVAPRGRVLAAADGDPAVLIADVEIREAREKRIVNIPGEYEIDVIGCRQPDLYAPITGM